MRYLLIRELGRGGYAVLRQKGGQYMDFCTELLNLGHQASFILPNAC